MAIQKTKFYTTDRSNYSSMLNVDIMSRFTDDDFTEFIITEKYKYRVDRIAEDYILDKRLSFLIMLINNVTSWSDLDAGNTILIPSRQAVNRVHDRIKLERKII